MDQTEAIYVSSVSSLGELNQLELALMHMAAMCADHLTTSLRSTPKYDAPRRSDCIEQ